MTLVLIGKGLVLEVDLQKIDVICVPGKCSPSMTQRNEIPRAVFSL